ncbi:hypothetical protein ACNSOS_00905 [Aliarcobacter vitoriensis]|uniref:hypothetical protein n=1 Tax=Aliarcobacter vitoriensis TaxID=2011099 RepID=UPI003AAC01BC
MKIFLLSILSIFILGGCSQKVLITATKPAIVDRASKTKKIAVLKFENDNISMGSKIESALYKVEVDNKPYFTVISKNRDDILNEQKFQYSGLANKKNSVEIGELLGAQALITGKINNADMQKDYYYERRYRCLDAKCIRQQEYLVQCTNARYSLKANISMIDVEKGDVIYTNNYFENTSYRTCLDYGGGLPSKSAVFESLSDNIVRKFLPNISPTVEKYYIKVFEDPQIKYTKEQELILENALSYLKHNHLDRAEELFSQLLNSTNDRCYLAAYNLGVIKESKGEYENAKELYNLADKLIDKPDSTIIESINRINTQISNHNKLQEQINIKE